MLSSEVTPRGLRPASPNSLNAYRPASREVVAAAVRARVSYPKPPNLSRNATSSQYEFPGDRGYQRFKNRTS